MKLENWEDRMRKKVNVEGLAKAIADELSSYKQDVTDELKKEVKSASKECVKEIKKTAPERTGKYKKSWTAKTIYESKDNIAVEIYSKKEYRRTHLLENGHDVKRDGKVVGHARAYKHIQPAEEKVADKLEKKVRIIVKGGNS